MKAVRVAEGAPVRAERTDAEVANAALRLMHLLERPAAVPVLHVQLLREMHYWLLAGRHGPAIQRLGWPDGRICNAVARAVAVLRAEFAQPLPVERLAAVAGMSLSSFHQHFRAVTSLSPLQFQKQLRLIEARRLMLAEGVSSSSAAFAVGYESVSQFTREYARMFGLPPARETEAARSKGKRGHSPTTLRFPQAPPTLSAQLELARFSTAIERARQLFCLVGAAALGALIFAGAAGKLVRVFLELASPPARSRNSLSAPLKSTLQLPLPFQLPSGMYS